LTVKGTLSSNATLSSSHSARAPQQLPDIKNAIV
jgi:hypothetical protein